MHDTALLHAKLFFDTYAGDGATATIVDVGAQDVNGSLREVAPPTAKYIGVDFVAGKGVDVVIDDPYVLPFEDESIDMCVSSSCFEHSEFFWIAFLEVLRILKPDGLFYLNVPSNGFFHRYPVDCWRLYPDSGVALQNWARRNKIDATMLESFTGLQKSGVWNDFVGVFVKDTRMAAKYPRRIIDRFTEFTNGRKFGTETIFKESMRPEDQGRWFNIRKRIGWRLGLPT